jgi:GAF domain-containing protein
MDETEQRQWSQDEQLLVKQVADQLSLALENARLFQESQARAEELAVLNQLAQSLSSQLNIDQIVDTIYNGITRLIDAKNFYVGFYDARTNEIIFPKTVSESELEREITRLPLGQGITSYMIQTGESILITDGSEKWTKEKGIKTVGVPSKSFLGVPLSRGGKALGAMAVQNFDEYNAYNQHDLQVLTAFAGQVQWRSKTPACSRRSEPARDTSEALQIARLGYFEIDHATRSVKLTDSSVLLGTSVERKMISIPLDDVMQRFILEEDIRSFSKPFRM